MKIGGYTKFKKVDLNKARWLANVFIFIDDLAAINDGAESERSYKAIYLPGFELKRGNSGNTEGSFLDHFINVEGNKFSLKLFDKRNIFPFSIVRMPHLTSNIPLRMFYGAYGAEISRMIGITSTKTNFINPCSTLISRMINQGGNVNTTSKTLSEIFGRHFETSRKFFATSLEFVEPICTWNKYTWFFWLGKLWITLYVLIIFVYCTDFGEADCC